jgi:hypothetical protein
MYSFNASIVTALWKEKDQAIRIVCYLYIWLRLRKYIFVTQKLDVGKYYGKNNPYTGLESPSGLQEVVAPRISRQSVHEGGTVLLYHQEISVVLISVRG